MSFKNLFLIAFLFIIVFYSINVPVKAVENDSVYSYDKFLTSSLINVYQEYISPINYTTCPMNPSCSQYAKQCFQQMNPIIAVLKTTDRLLRCSNDLEHYKTVNINGAVRYNDLPIKSNNTYRNAKIQIARIDFNSDYKQNDNKTVDGKTETGIIKSANEKLLFDFAKELELNHEYDKAIIEYKRLLSYYPNSKYRSRALISIFSINFLTRNYMAVITWGNKIINSNDIKIVNEVDLKYYMAVAFINLENFKMAREKLFDIIPDIQDTDYRSKVNIIIGTTYVYEEQWAKAIDYFDLVNNNSIYYKTANHFKELANNGKGISYKSPKLAAFLGVIPGMGYLYDGYKKTALSSLIVNGLLYMGASKAFENDNDALGILLAAFNFGFYAGNIYGSYETARNVNEDIKGKYMSKFNIVLNKINY
ncbi:membrane protein insertion efficiency factor YidD [Iocasia frigidifontis]|uniref:Membrane protein insertion efficiency factor YidD n=1 Tax=Iocasia fonsfrigidae TaxID=2682810 RepID=A0A8A7KEM9_9FIRM|nr:membrane protein insertion efficiency factor YidD [Iocasia fonsfrigidae]QTL97357.1 membrane protein insertion efficiency factor YidD [Iocasia fonsfrigidae]